MKHIKYLWYIIRHKYYVTIECFKIGLIWRGLMHDLSKFLPDEWFPYADYFYGEYNSFNEIPHDFRYYVKTKESVKEAFDLAWLKHIHRNKHHWQYWILRNDDGPREALEMPDKYLKEMLCDWIGAGKAITGKNDLKIWYAKNKDKMTLHPNTRSKVEEVLSYLK